jgi:hypothetical protein
MVGSKTVWARWGTLAAGSTAGVLIGCSGTGQAPQASDMSLSTADGGKGDAGRASDATANAVEAGRAEAGGPDAVGVGEAGSLGDSGTFDGGGVSCFEGGAGPKGTQIVRSATASILGLTDDDAIVYTEGSSSTLFTVPAAGGAPTSIGPTEGSTAIASKAVFNWTGLNQTGTVGTGLQVWTAGSGSQSLASASLVGTADSSADGSKVLYFDGATDATADLYVAGIDGSNKTKLFAGVPWTQSCMPRVSFVGSSAVLAYCPTADASVGNLALYAGAAGAAQTLSTTAVPSFQSVGTSILYNDARGLVVADTMTGSTTLVDSAGSTSAAFTHDRQSIVYLTTDGAIRRSSIASPAPMTLVDADGFIGLSSLSPDDQWLLAFKTQDPNSGNTDIYIASATTAGFAAPIVDSAIGAFFGSAFTADSSRVVYVGNPVNGAGDYYVAPTSGGPGVPIASQVWIGFATSGARLVYQDGYVASVGLNGQGAADIESIDLAGVSPTPSLLVSQADPYIYFTSGGDRVVYSMSFCAIGSEGIWVMPTP